mmetsp:Transcript_48750/g.104064  ORF Transcript_48750/g.104064 Transcript_48750/m.104064 type:complete len:112 (-) Transcript_48750:337-672(-)
MRRRAMLLLSFFTCKLAAAVRQPLPLMRRPTLPFSLAVRMASGEVDLSKLTVIELKERLRAANLPISGKKAVLLERLGGAPAAAAPAHIFLGLEPSAVPFRLPVEVEACRQ